MPHRILVVDDEHSIVDTVALIFESVGYVTVRAYSGIEALTRARQACPNLLLCDVMMPDLNGFEVAFRIKEICPGCRILLFSGDISVGRVRDDFALHFQERGYRYELLSKPLHPVALLDKVQQSLLSRSPSKSADANRCAEAS